ncbi:Aminoglycoside phosphotransferase [Kitasatospora sp. MMS16-BH015]|uniref:aminoglycoside phosphotransferase family protein n=1 Tax=Kitasatospora sp. MMS16-BH015 TaxID=2018025 RepID=UPI000CA227D5|nr:aminoglycoside phosphotransferase family protein [Kitasatospora sp. MMS16-BH015]AUG79125.1 Aminoglycoside phosphotransferase [Kitasatospora sp. MMS16-BH015]
MTESAEAAHRETAVTTDLVRRLVARQFPQWADLPLALVDPAGSDHVIHRLGGELAVRLPRHRDAVGQAHKEHRWLPLLAPHLPLAVPIPVALGEPGLGYPWPWSVARWLDGAPATPQLPTDSPECVPRLAAFLTALHRAPAAGPHPELTVETLADRDADTRSAIAELGGPEGPFDGSAMTRLWTEALAAPDWERPPVWVHGDFHTGNLLTRDGQLSAVIDFGGLGLGDPACDLTIAFTLFDPGPRAAFRAALGLDGATWLRGRAWALATGLNAHRWYAATHPRVAAQTTRQIRAALAG